MCLWHCMPGVYIVDVTQGHRVPLTNMCNPSARPSRPGLQGRGRHILASGECWGLRPRRPSGRAGHRKPRRKLGLRGGGPAETCLGTRRPWAGEAPGTGQWERGGWTCSVGLWKFATLAEWRREGGSKTMAENQLEPLGKIIKHIT